MDPTLILIDVISLAKEAELKILKFFVMISIILFPPILQQESSLIGEAA